MFSFRSFSFGIITSRSLSCSVPRFPPCLTVHANTLKTCSPIFRNPFTFHPSSSYTDLSSHPIMHPSILLQEGQPTPQYKERRNPTRVDKPRQSAPLQRDFTPRSGEEAVAGDKLGRALGGRRPLAASAQFAQGRPQAPALDARLLVLVRGGSLMEVLGLVWLGSGLCADTACCWIDTVGRDQFPQPFLP